MSELNLELEVILEISQRALGRDGRLCLQIEQWKKAGENCGGRKICNREYYTGKDGILRYGKAKGLSLSDLDQILMRREEIVSLLKDGSAKKLSDEEYKKAERYAIQNEHKYQLPLIDSDDIPF